MIRQKPGIVLSNNHRIEFALCSGAHGFGNSYPHKKPFEAMGLIDPKLFDAIITKTIYLKEHQGNFNGWNIHQVLKPIWEKRKIVGWVNSFGHTNKGLLDHAPDLNLAINKGLKIILSIGGTEKEIVEIVKFANDYKLVAIELCLSCPNVSCFTPGQILKICQKASLFSIHPIILKLNYGQDFYLEITQELKGIIEAIDINTIPWKKIFPKKKSPLRKYGPGAVSGKVAQKLNWKMARQIKKEAKIPVIMPGIWEYADIEKAFKIGDAVSFGSVGLLDITAPTRWVKKYQKEYGK